jgi:tRNA(Ile)-lysidine synthase
VRLLRAQHRRLAGARPLAIACSAGADSSALAIAAAAAKICALLVHIQHDLRPLDLAQQDAAATLRLASLVGLPATVVKVAIPRTHNAEAAARRARYCALTATCDAQGLACLATAHHAGDQYESVLAACVSGGGLSALSGIAPRRWLRRPQPASNAAGILLIRPFLTADPADLRALCRDSGWPWQDDHTNADTSHLRSAIRHLVLPAIANTGRSPQGQYAAAAAIARCARESVIANRTRVRELLAPIGPVIPRQTITSLDASIRMSLLRAWILRENPAIAKRDLGPKRLDPILTAICDHSTHPRRWHLPASTQASSQTHLLLQAHHLTLHTQPG